MVTSDLDFDFCMTAVLFSTELCHCTSPVLSCWEDIHMAPQEEAGFQLGFVIRNKEATHRQR